MENDKRYFTVGVFVLVLLLGGLIFSLWLTRAGRGDMLDYRIHFAESVSGLKVGSQVKFRGVNIGEVKKIEIDPEDIRMIRVDIHVLKSTPVKSDTVAALKLQDISGNLYVELTGNKKDAPDLVASAGGAPPEIHAEKSSLNAVINRLPEIVDKTNTLLEKANHIASQIDKIFSDHNVALVNSVIRKLAGYLNAKDDKQDKRSED